MPKNCDKCNAEYTGFGTTCGECRKAKGGAAPAPSGDSEDMCKACGKKAYAMERIVVEGQCFHPTCFKCFHCNSKLNVGKFSKDDQGRFWCKTHYEQMFKVRGRYSITKDALDKGEGEDDGEEGAKIERQMSTKLASKAADIEQLRRVGEAEQADHDAEVERKQNQKRVSLAQGVEQLRRIGELEQIDHDAGVERKQNQKAALEAEDQERERRLSEDGEGMKKIPSLPNPEDLTKKIGDMSLQEDTS